MSKHPDLPLPPVVGRRLTIRLPRSRPITQSTLVELWTRRTLSTAAGDVAARRLIDLQRNGKP
jgi:hypothetical protein